MEIHKLPSNFPFQKSHFPHDQSFLRKTNAKIPVVQVHQDMETLRSLITVEVSLNLLKLRTRMMLRVQCQNGINAYLKISNEYNRHCSLYEIIISRPS